MWCTGCGAPLSASARYCADCGRPHHAASHPVPLADPHRKQSGEPCASGRRLGGFAIRETGIREAVSGTTLGGLETTGEQLLYEVRGPVDLALWLAYVTWDGGEREVRRTRRHETLWWQDHLLGRQRLAVESWGSSYDQVELCQAQLDDTRAVRLAEASEYELDAYAGACLRCALLSVGATAMGSRQEVLGVGDERRHVICTTFPREARRVAVVAFALTRVAPLLNRLSRSA